MRSCATTFACRSIFGPIAPAKASRGLRVVVGDIRRDGRQGFLDPFSTPITCLGCGRSTPTAGARTCSIAGSRARSASARPVRRAGAGLKFFNVYGPNEYHKGSQRSVAVQMHAQIRERGGVRLFRSENPKYADGGQMRDFVWVGDCVRFALWALEDPTAPSGLYTPRASLRFWITPKSCSRKWASNRTWSLSIRPPTCGENTNITPAPTWIKRARPVSLRADRP